MTSSEAVQEILTSDPHLLDIVPADRIRVPGPWQGMTPPYIIHVPVAVAPVRTHGGLDTGLRWTYQISVYASNVSQGETIALAVIAALEGVHSVWSPPESVHITWTGGHWYGGRAEEYEIEYFLLEFEVTQMS